MNASRQVARQHFVITVGVEQACVGNGGGLWLGGVGTRPTSAPGGLGGDHLPGQRRLGREPLSAGRPRRITLCHRAATENSRCLQIRLQTAAKSSPEGAPPAAFSLLAG
jgi:hypothetical protein